MQSVKTFRIPVSLVIITATLLVMSGACSMHDPGPYEGGGRTTTAPFPDTTDDGSAPIDNFVPPQDTGGGNDVQSGG